MKGNKKHLYPRFKKIGIFGIGIAFLSGGIFWMISSADTGKTVSFENAEEFAQGELVGTQVAGSGEEAGVTLTDRADWYEASAKAVPNWYNNAWEKRKKIVINHKQFSESLTNYPVYVDLSDLGDEFFDATKNACGDIRVTLANGTTETARELVSCNVSQKTGSLYFLAPELSHQSDSLFYVYFDNASAFNYGDSDSKGKNAVWPSDLKAFWRLDDDPAGPAPQVRDATNNGVNGTVNGITVEESVEGVIGNAMFFDPGDSVDFASSVVGDNEAVTFGGWIKPDVSGDGYVFSRGRDGYGAGWSLAINAKAGFLPQVRVVTTNPSTAGLSAYGQTRLATNTWYHIMGVWKPGERIQVYVNGKLDGEFLTTSSQLRSSTVGVRLGKLHESFWFQGGVDDFRIYNRALGAEEVRIIHANARNSEQFYFVDTLERRGESLSLGTWEYRRAITVDTAFVPETLSQFPARVDLTSFGAEFFDHIRGDCADIRVTLADGTTELPREIAWCDVAGNRGEMFFRAPQIVAGDINVFYVYYGNENAYEYAPNDSYGAFSVWGGEYVFVSHDGGQTDSTGRQSPALGGGIDEPGEFGGLGISSRFDGVDDHIDVTRGVIFSEYAVSLWAHADPSPVLTGQRIFHNRVNPGGYGNIIWYMWNNDTGRPVLAHNQENTTGINIVPLDDLRSNITYLGSSYNANEGLLTGYANEFKAGSRGALPPFTSGDYFAMAIGRDPANSNSAVFFDGVIDEVRVSSSPKSDAWFSAEYASQSQEFFLLSDVEITTVSGTYTTSPQDLIYLSSFGDGTDSSTAFLANVSDLSPDATITFSLRASDTQENLLTTPFTEIGTASSDGAFTKTKAQFDALGIPTGSAGRFIQIKADFSVSDQAFTPTLDDLTLLYMADDTPPETNASNLQMKKHLTGEEVAQGDWTNHLSPYFSWDPGTDSQSSLKGYCLYLGTDPSGNPETAKGLLGTSPLDTTGTTCQFITDQTTLDFANTALRGNPWITSSPNPYFVSIKAIDLAGNITDTATTFSFRFDNTPPTPPKYISLPSDFVSTKDITILWVASGGDAPQDNDSAIAGLQYRLGNTPWYGENHTGTQDATDLLVNDGAYTLHDPIDYENLAEGVTIVEMRAFDNAGNISTTTISGSIKLNTIAPSMPRDLSVTPQDAQTNEYTFFWSPPETFSGQENRLTYCYTVNTLPTMSTCTYTNPGTTNVPKDAYATQPGDNTFYVVAKDEAGNINYATRAEITFTYSGTAPGIPMGLDIADVSVKATESWKLALSWEEPENIGAGVAKYKIFRSQDNQTFSEVATATDISYVDTNLEQKEYFYKVKACDSANNCGAFSGVVSLYPDGKFTESAELSSQPEVVDITTKRATIKWTTKRGSDSRVQYGKKSGSYYDEEPSKSEQTTSHEINLTSLSAGTRYYYRAKWVDEDGNVGISEEKTFKTDPAPEVSETSIATLGIDTATITFTSKHADRLEVLYGESTSFGGRQEVSTGSDTSNHTVALQGLRDGTKYFYRIISYDVEEESYEGDIYSFTTLERPRIENVRLQQVRNAPEPTILVTWNSNTEISSIVTYQPEDGSAPSKDAVDVTLVAGEHRVILAPLEADKRYTLTVRGTDAFGNEAISDAQTFTTATDTRPPQISSLTVEGSNVRVAESDSPTSSQLSVSWNTDEPSTSQVEFGEGTGTTYTQKTQEDANLTTNHLVIVSGLTPSKVYHLRALSKDQAGNLSSSIDTVTITPKATESAFNLVLMNLKEIFGLL